MLISDPASPDALSQAAGTGVSTRSQAGRPTSSAQPPDSTGTRQKGTRPSANSRAPPQPTSTQQDRRTTTSQPAAQQSGPSLPSSRSSSPDNLPVRDIKAAAEALGVPVHWIDRKTGEQMSPERVMGTCHRQLNLIVSDHFFRGHKIDMVK